MQDSADDFSIAAGPAFPPSQDAAPQVGIFDTSTSHASRLEPVCQLVACTMHCLMV